MAGTLPYRNPVSAVLPELNWPRTELRVMPGAVQVVDASLSPAQVIRTVREPAQLRIVQMLSDADVLLRDLRYSHLAPEGMQGHVEAVTAAALQAWLEGDVSELTSALAQLGRSAEAAMATGQDMDCFPVTEPGTASIDASRRPRLPAQRHQRSRRLRNFDRA